MVRFVWPGQTAIGARLAAVVLAGAFLHFGTAAMRVDALLPVPRCVDFASYYAGAWSLRAGVSPYDWSPGLLAALTDHHGLPADLVDRDGVVPGHNSPPLWAWLMRPVTWLDFPAATAAWLSLSVLLVVWSSRRLARIAGHGDGAALALLPVVLSFGPVFLSLVLGQNSLLLLVAALVVGQALARPPGRVHIGAAALWGVAIAAKLFPAVWLAALPLVGRWRLLVVTGALTGVLFGAAWWAEPAIHEDYWFRFLPERAEGFSAHAVFGDQSLSAWLTRVGRPHSFDVYLLSSSPAALDWTPPWSISMEALQVVNAALLASIGLWILFVRSRCRRLDDEGFFYLMLLFALLCFPHMARYNHALALPAMAWLWREPARRPVVAGVYLLLGLSRAINPLIVALPAPVGMLASGVGVIAILWLGAATGRTLSRVVPAARPVPAPAAYGPFGRPVP